MRAKNLLQFFYLATSAFTLAACGGGNGGGNVDQFHFSVQGDWKSGCQNNGLDNSYSQVALSVDVSTFEFSNTLYTDPRCLRPKMTFVSSGMLTEHDDLAGAEETQGARIDFEIQSITLTPRNTDVASGFNIDVWCGHGSWATDVSVDIAHCDTVADSVVPRTEYDVYIVDAGPLSSAGDDQLFLGALRGTSPETRPAESDWTNPYRRQP